MFEIFTKLFSRGVDPAKKHAGILAERRRLQAEHDAAVAALDDYDCQNYYMEYDRARFEAAGKTGWMLPADFTPPPTPAQWATLTPEQKADTAHPVMFKD